MTIEEGSFHEQMTELSDGRWGVANIRCTYPNGFVLLLILPGEIEGEVVREIRMIWAEPKGSGLGGLALQELAAEEPSKLVAIAPDPDSAGFWQKMKERNLVHDIIK